MAIRDPTSKKLGYIPATVTDFDATGITLQYQDKHSKFQLITVRPEEAYAFHRPSEQIGQGTVVYAPWYDSSAKVFCYPLYEATTLARFEPSQPSSLLRVKFKGERSDTFVDAKWVLVAPQ
ncbi:hypothetical protein SS50377_23981 [Spironucleus salmonicida]|nr:hypothetical protein SS50377_23981 [Spironucleus salmonicida]